MIWVNVSCFFFWTCNPVLAFKPLHFNFKICGSEFPSLVLVVDHRCIQIMSLNYSFAYWQRHFIALLTACIALYCVKIHSALPSSINASTPSFIHSRKFYQRYSFLVLYYTFSSKQLSILNKPTSGCVENEKQWRH